MGRVAGPYGLRGWLKVAPESGAAEGLEAAKEWWIGATAYQVSGAKNHGAAMGAKPPGVGNRERALGLKGQTVSVRREALPEPEEGRYYLDDLIGLEVVNQKDEVLGVVKRMF